MPLQYQTAKNIEKLFLFSIWIFYISEASLWIVYPFQGYNMYKVELLSHKQNSILGIWKVSDFSKSCYQLHIHSSFQFCVIQFCSQFHKLATVQPKFAAYKCTLVFWSLSAKSLMFKSILTFTIGHYKYITVPSFFFFKLSN